MSTSPTPNKVLVTGASGYVGGHILPLLFARGYQIVCLVRTPESGALLARKFPGLEYQVVEDMAAPGIEDKLQKVFEKHADTKYILHLATPMQVTDPTSFGRSFVDPAVAGTEALLAAARDFGPQVRKFVFTSSVVALYPRQGGKHPDLTISEEDWNPITREMADSGYFAGYIASKKFAERAVLDFAAQHRDTLNFSVTSLVCPFAWGPPVHDVHWPHFDSSLHGFFHLITLPADTKPEGFLNLFAGYADVRDIARVHVLALEKAGFDNGRFLPMAGLADDQRIVDIIHAYRPEQAAALGVPKGQPGSFDREQYFKYNVDKTLALLDFEFIPFEKTILDEFDAFVALKQEFDASQANA